MLLIELIKPVGKHKAKARLTATPEAIKSAGLKAGDHFVHLGTYLNPKDAEKSPRLEVKSNQSAKAATK